MARVAATVTDLVTEGVAGDALRDVGCAAIAFTATQAPNAIKAKAI